MKKKEIYREMKEKKSIKKKTNFRNLEEEEEKRNVGKEGKEIRIKF